MRRKLLILSVLVLCLATMTAGTHAYYVSRGTAVNVVTAGNVRVMLRGVKPGKTMPVVPGTEVEQAPRVENTGDNPAYIRIRLSRQLSAARGKLADTDLIMAQIDRKYWVYRDGFYYYRSALEPGDVTEPLYGKIVFSPEIDDRYQGGRAKVSLQVQAVQTANNGTGPLKAAGWPGSE